jgi:hypothetical protein
MPRGSGPLCAGAHTNITKLAPTSATALTSRPTASRCASDRPWMVLKSSTNRAACRVRFLDVTNAAAQSRGLPH